MSEGSYGSAEMATPAIRVAVIDSGWDLSCRDDRVELGVGLVDPNDELTLGTSDEQDRIGHGTACVDLVLRASPLAHVVPIRVFGARLETSANVLAAAILTSVDLGVQVINLSLGTSQADAAPILYDACEYAYIRGICVIAACNNRGSYSLPAAFNNVIGVGSTSDLGPLEFEYRHGDVAEFRAAHSQTDVRLLNGLRGTVSGTSFAAPIISGVVAGILAKYPCVSLTELRQILSETAVRAVPCVDRRNGHGV